MILTAITDAARARRVIKISYLDKKNVHTVRAVEPYEVRDGKLWAHCLQRDAIRQFDLNRIVQAVPTERTFTPRHEVRLDG